MSKIIIPPLTERPPELDDPAWEQQLPRPVGYTLLVALPPPEDTYGRSGLLKTDTAKAQEQLMAVVGKVLDMGPDAYADKERFSEPWCKVGDFVVFATHAGNRLLCNGNEYRLMNDDSIQAVVEDPRGVSRAGGTVR